MRSSLSAAALRRSSISASTRTFSHSLRFLFVSLTPTTYYIRRTYASPPFGVCSRTAGRLVPCRTRGRHVNALAAGVASCPCHAFPCWESPTELSHTSGVTVTLPSGSIQLAPAARVLRKAADRQSSKRNVLKVSLWRFLPTGVPALGYGVGCELDAFECITRRFGEGLQPQTALAPPLGLFSVP